MAKAIMIQGTMSNAGKSLIAAGLCRVFARMGYRTAPFKSQNMALNSFITADGLEMGRAQAMQAEAAGIRPQVCMNPILLKPTNDTGSQVIVNGRVRGTMSAREYFSYKKELIPDILDAYHKLEQEYDVIIIEGAGSPAEINLKQDDIVNMGLAELLGVPALLVGDIDRGGVFAQLYGTVELLEEKERARICGMIINKFRGDRTILDPGIAMIEEKLRIPVVGVVPYMHLDLEDEDSLSVRLCETGEVKGIDIAVIRLPRISNFTDFNALEGIAGVSLRYVGSLRELKEPDMVILPGTKNTMEDLLWMRQNGLEAAVLKLAAAGKIVFGVCGGYQMLGETLSDPGGAEAGGSIRGMGLLPADTVFTKRKVRTRVKGAVSGVGGILSGMGGIGYEGYEIHMGNTVLRDGARPFGKIEDMTEKSEERNAGGAAEKSKERNAGGAAERSGRQKEDGAWKGNVYGTYVHGIFDDGRAAKCIIDAIGAAKGLDTSMLAARDYRAYKETQYELLADQLLESLNMDVICGQMGLRRLGGSYEHRI